MNTAILFDTMSIQQYVFGSNKLKDNLGASYIVEHIYDYLKEKSNANPTDLEIGYIGGGNALVYTISETKAKEIIKDYTTHLLHSFPGISLAVAINSDFKNENYPSAIKELFGMLAENKGKYLPINTISSHGITDTCRFSSLTVEKIEIYPVNKVELMSSSTVTKRIFEEKARLDEKELLKEQVLKNYSFPDELDDLGQLKGEDSHIAVVHVDGNGFGKVFRDLKNVNDTRDLSNKVKNVVQEAFVDALKAYVNIEVSLESIIERKSFLNNILPIRPIILGGDDVTFVCHGKLGIWFAEKYMESFKHNTFTDSKGVEQKFSSCAGVAIVKTKYPFYRAYELAEKLCESAKSARKMYMEGNNIEDGGNWIDFQLAYSGLGNTLEEVRKLQFYNIKGDKPLYKRPFCIDPIDGQITIEELKEFAATLKDVLPNSKIKDLREILTRDKDSQKVFIEHLKHQHKEFNKAFCNEMKAEEILAKYPFFDMIEFLELYPTNLLNDI